MGMSVSLGKEYILIIRQQGEEVACISTFLTGFYTRCLESCAGEIRLWDMEHSSGSKSDEPEARTIRRRGMSHFAVSSCFLLLFNTLQCGKMMGECILQYKILK